jgi:hypothetical protein
VKRDRLQAALRHFRQTSHPEGARRAQETAASLEALEKAIAENEANAVPPEVGQLRTAVDRLCEASSFEEALAKIAQASDLLARFPKTRDELLTSTRNRQRAALKNYETLLVSRLDSISRTDPTYEAEIVLPMLAPARVPPEVVKDPEPRFKWLLDFLARYEKDLETVRSAATLEPDRLLPAAAAFDALAKSALENDLFNGFRAARNMAHSITMARLKELAAAAEKPDSELPGSAAFQAAVAKLLEAVEASRAAAEALLSASTSADAKKYAAADLPYQKRQIDGVRAKIREVTVAHERRVAAEAVALEAETRLLHPDVMARPAELAKVTKSLSTLESQAYFETLPAPVRARTLCARAVSEAVAAFLDAEPPARAAERCRNDFLRAIALDANALKPWTDKGRLSPRLVELFERIRK